MVVAVSKRSFKLVSVTKCYGCLSSFVYLKASFISVRTLQTKTRETKTKGVSLRESLKEDQGAQPYCSYVSYFYHRQDFHPEETPL